MRLTRAPARARVRPLAQPVGTGHHHQHLLQKILPKALKKAKLPHPKVLANMRVTMTTTPEALRFSINGLKLIVDGSRPRARARAPARARARTQATAKEKALAEALAAGSNIVDMAREDGEITSSGLHAAQPFCRQGSRYPDEGHRSVSGLLTRGGVRRVPSDHRSTLGLVFFGLRQVVHMYREVRV